MNKNLFLTLSAFLFLFPLSGKATGTYRPETSVAGFIQLPGSGRQYMISIRAGASSKATYLERKQ